MKDVSVEDRMNAVTTNDPGRLGELFSPEKRNLEKVENNAVRCFGVTSCVEKTKAQSNRSTPVCQWAFERCKSRAENDLRTNTTDGRPQPRRRGAKNNLAGSLRGIRPCSRNRLRENSLRRSTRIPQLPIVVARRSQVENNGPVSVPFQAGRRCLSPFSGGAPRTPWKKGTAPCPFIWP